MQLDPQKVHGWLTEAEGAKLAELAAGKTVLEFGTFAGRSAIYMARTARIVHTIDVQIGYQGQLSSPTLLELLQNLVAYGVSEKVFLHIGRSADMPLPGRYFDMAFIDGDHSLPGVETDCRLALQAVKPGGIIAMHDFNYQGVLEGAQKTVVAAGGRLIDVVDNMGIFQIPA